MHEPLELLCCNLIFWSGDYLPRSPFTCLTDCGFLICQQPGAAPSKYDMMHLHNGGFWEPCLIWPLLHWDVPYNICNISATMPTVTISSPNVFGLGANATVSEWGLIAAWTFNSAILFFLALSWRLLALSPYCGCINSWRIICFCPILPMYRCTVFEIPPITLSVSSSLLSFLCSVSSLLVSHLPHPTDPRNLKRCFNWLWHHSSPGQMCFQAIWISIPHISRFSYLPPVACSVCLNWQHIWLQQQSPYLHNPRFIELSLS